MPCPRPTVKRTFVPKTNGFSLLELLVVLLILSVLIAIAIPALRKSSDQAKGVRCMGNLRTIGTGLGKVVADLGYYPGLRPVQHTAGKDRWYQLLQLYIDGVTAGSTDPIPKWLQCPSLDKPVSRNAESANLQDLGYGYNKDGFGDTADRDYWQIRPAQVELPSQKIVIGDNRDSGGYSTMLYGGAPLNQRASRHNHGGYYLHADGHVQWWKDTELSEKLTTSRNSVWLPY